MQVQPSLVLLQKTLLNIEGLGKQLYPELDLWQTALPFLENWQKQRLSPLNNLKQLRDRLPEWIEQAPELPDLIYGALQQAGQSQQHIEQLNARIDSLEGGQTRKTPYRWVLFALLLVVMLATFPSTLYFLHTFAGVVLAGLLVGLGYYLARR